MHVRRWIRRILGLAALALIGLVSALTGIAVRKAGLDPDYVHPLVLDHGQR